MPAPANIRYRLLSDYLDELWSIKGLPPMPEAEKLKLYTELTGTAYTHWIDIRKEKEIIGFLIIGTAPNCHPDADFYIEEAYIIPDFRRKGYMSAAVSEFEKAHKGTYCLFVLNENTPAKLFWEKFFQKLGYQPCFLRDVGAGDEYCTQYGFEPKE